MHPTREEIMLIRDYILLPFMLDIIENARRKLEFARIPLSEIYLAANDALMERKHSELLRVKAELKSRRIKITEMDNEPGLLNYEYWCRGYRREFSILTEVARAEISIRLGKDVESISRVLRN